MDMDKEMIRALEADAAMLEALGAGKQCLAVEGDAVGMRLADARRGLWDVYDHDGSTVAAGLSIDAAEKMIAGDMTATASRQAAEHYERLARETGSLVLAERYRKAAHNARRALGGD